MGCLRQANVTPLFPTMGRAPDASMRKHRVRAQALGCSRGGGWAGLGLQGRNKGISNPQLSRGQSPPQAPIAHPYHPLQAYPGSTSHTISVLALQKTGSHPMPTPPMLWVWGWAVPSAPGPKPP